MALFLESLVFAFGGLLAGTLYAMLVVPGEERFLAARLGPVYGEYRNVGARCAGYGSRSSAAS